MIRCVKCNREVTDENRAKAKFHIHLRCQDKSMFKAVCDLCGTRTTKLRYIGKNKVACLECYAKHEAKLEQKTGDEPV